MESEELPTQLCQQRHGGRGVALDQHAVSRHQPFGWDSACTELSERRLTGSRLVVSWTIRQMPPVLDWCSRSPALDVVAQESVQ